MARFPRPERPSADEITRAERRAERRAAERGRLPQHGKGMGLMVGNALLRRAAGPHPHGRARTPR